MKKTIFLTLIMLCTFQLVLNSETEMTDQKQKAKITFIELGSVKCIPCKMMQPVMKEIEKIYADTVEVIFYDVWTDEGKPKGKEYNIKLIPTQIFLDENGEEFFRHEGFFSKDDIVELIEKQLKKTNNSADTE